MYRSQVEHTETYTLSKTVDIGLLGGSSTLDTDIKDLRSSTGSFRFFSTGLEVLTSNRIKRRRKCMYGRALAKGCGHVQGEGASSLVSDTLIGFLVGGRGWWLLPWRTRLDLILWRRGVVLRRRWMSSREGCGKGRWFVPHRERLKLTLVQRDLVRQRCGVSFHSSPDLEVIFFQSATFKHCIHMWVYACVEINSSAGSM